MEALREANSTAYEARMLALRFRNCLFRLRASEETWQDEQKLRINLVRCVYPAVAVPGL